MPVVSSVILLTKDEVFSVLVKISCDLEKSFTEASGTTVYTPATRIIPAQTVVDISPVLLFGKEEYAAHGKYTVLNQYTFVWKGGQQALALGLGETPLGFSCIFFGLQHQDYDHDFFHGTLAATIL